MSAAAPLRFSLAAHGAAPQPWRKIAAGALAALGTAELVAMLYPGSGLSALVPLAPAAGTPVGLTDVLVTCLAVAALALSRGLWRGRRRALEAAVLGAAIVVVAAVAAGAELWSGIGALVAVGLVAGREAFPRGCTRPRDPLTVGFAAIAAAAGAAMYALLALPPLLADRVSGIGAALDLAASRIASGAWWLEGTTPLALGLDVLVIVALGSAGVYLYTLLKPGTSLDGHTEREHRRARAIMSEHCVDSLDPFALREDKAFHFHRDGFLSYRTLRGTAVVSGDPVGPPGGAADTLADFLDFASERDWDVVVTGASGRHLEAYRRLGLRAMPIGDEAVVDPCTFSLEGRGIRKVRQSVARVTRRGWSIECVPADQLEPALIAGLDGVERAWRSTQPRLQGFAMTLGRLWGAPEDAEALYVVARSPAGDIASFLRFAGYQGGLSLDVTRRLGEEPNGLAEAMVVAALEWAREHDLSAVSLNFAGFAHLLGADAVLGGRQRVVRRALRATHGRFQLERLMVFCSKFGPTWEPRYLLYGGRTQLPRAGLRVLQAEAYIRPPRSHGAPDRWMPAQDPVPSLAVAAGADLEPAR